MNLDDIRTASDALRLIGAELASATVNAEGEYRGSTIAHWADRRLATTNADGSLTLGAVITTPSREQTETHNTLLTSWNGGRALVSGIFLPDDEWIANPAVIHPPDHIRFDPRITVTPSILDATLLADLMASDITPEYTRALAALGIVDAAVWLALWGAGIPVEYAVEISHSESPRAVDAPRPQAAEVAA